VPCHYCLCHLLWVENLLCGHRTFEVYKTLLALKSSIVIWSRNLLDSKFQADIGNLGKSNPTFSPYTKYYRSIEVLPTFNAFQPLYISFLLTECLARERILKQPMSTHSGSIYSDIPCPLWVSVLYRLLKFL
jgi:hypothetical protein